MSPRTNRPRRGGRPAAAVPVAGDDEQPVGAGAYSGPEQLVEWDGDFRDDGTLFLVCSERDVEIEEYRQVLEQHIGYRFADK